MLYSDNILGRIKVFICDPCLFDSLEILTVAHMVCLYVDVHMYHRLPESYVRSGALPQGRCRADNK